MELFSRAPRKSRYAIVCVMATSLLFLVLFAAGSYRHALTTTVSVNSPSAPSAPIVCPESRWAETVSFADGRVLLLQRIFASISASVPVEAPASAADWGGVRMVRQVLESDVTAECSQWRTVGNCSVCQVGPLRPKPGSCVVLSQSNPRALSLASALDCRAVMSLPIDDLHDHAAAPVIDIFVAAWGGQTMASITEAMKDGWLVNVRQLVLGADVSPGAASWTQLRALLSVVDSVNTLGFRQWRVPTILGTSTGATRRRQMLLHFINKEMLFAKQPLITSPNPHLSAPDSAPTPAAFPYPLLSAPYSAPTPAAFPYPHLSALESALAPAAVSAKDSADVSAEISAEVSLLATFDRRSLEREIEASLAANQPSMMEVGYFHQVRNNHATCPYSQRLGDKGDGGWDVCFSRPFNIPADSDRSSGCIAFSFGINYIYGYDNALAERFNCTVRMFDPSMKTMSDQQMGNRRQWFYQKGLAGKSGTFRGWQVRTLCSLIDEFTDSPNRVIDILKIDIEQWEWRSLETALAEGCLARVKQLLFETHTAMAHSSTPDYALYLRVWLQLVQAGFRMWKWHENPESFLYPSLGDSTSRLPCCYEHYMLNWNFVH